MRQPMTSRRLRAAALGALAALVGFAASGCGGEPPAPPRLLALEPATVAEGVDTVVTLVADTLPVRVLTRFEQPGSSQLDERYRVELDEHSLGPADRVDDHQLRILVPRTFGSGEYRLEVIDPWGRRLAAPTGLRVEGLAEQRDLVAALRISAVAPQVTDVGFAIEIEAVDPTGRRVTDAHGPVVLSDLTGTLVPSRISLVGGRWSGTVEVRQPLETNVIAASNAQGHRGESNPFPVATRPATALCVADPPNALVAGSCRLVRLQLCDASGAPTASGRPIAVELETAGAAAGLYADAACGMELPGLTFAAGASGAEFYWRALQAGSTQLEARASGLRNAVLRAQVTPGPASRLAFPLGPHELVAGACSAALTLELRDEYGNRTTDWVPTPVALEVQPAQTWSAHGAEGCAGAPVAEVTLPEGIATVSLSIIASKAGPLTLTAAAPGLDPAVREFVVSPGPPVSLVVRTAPQEMVAGSCAGPIVFELRDTVGNPTSVPDGLSIDVALRGGSGLVAAEPGCAAGIGSLELAPGSGVGTLYLAATAAGVVGVSASAPGIAAASCDVLVQAAPAERLAFVSPPLVPEAGACSGEVLVEARDAFENPTAPGLERVMRLSATPPDGITFFSDGLCQRAVEAVLIGPGWSKASFFFRGTRAQTGALEASVEGWAPAAQPVTIRAGAAAAFTWDPVASPATFEVPFDVTARSVDAWGNRTTAFSGSATLSLLPAAGFRCTSGCETAAVTVPFVRGVWTGSVAVERPGGRGLRLQATSGAMGGLSSRFDVFAPEAAPTAAFSVTPTIGVVGRTVVFDASDSRDLQTDSSALEVSWDFDGASQGPPWTPWTTMKSATHSFASAGRHLVRLAVRDDSGRVAVASREVHVFVESSPDLCTVTTEVPDLDDGAASCRGPFGADGKLSLREAIRLSNDTAGVQLVTFDRAMTLSKSIAFWVLDSMTIVGRPGVVFDAVNLIGAGGHLEVTGLEFRQQTAKIRADAGTTFTLRDSVIRDSAGLRIAGTATLERVLLQACTSECLRVDGDGSSLTLRQSTIRDAWTGLLLRRCRNTPSLDLQTTVFDNLVEAITSDPECTGSFLVRHNTFYANYDAVWFSAGAGHVVRNNLFVGSRGTALDAAAGASFRFRDHQLLYGNQSDGLLAADPSSLQTAPLFVDELARDLRLQQGSPARDSGVDENLDLNGQAPGLYEGAAPDRGAFETP